METRSLRVIRRTIIALLMAYSLIYYGLLIFIPGKRLVLSNAFTLLGEGVSLAVIGWGARRQNPAYRAEWNLFACGIGMNFLGDLLWSIYEVVWHLEVSLPSACDIFYLVGSVFYLGAFIYHLRQEKPTNIARTGLDMLITMVAGTAIIYKYIMLPISNNVSLTLLQKAVSMSYPILDIGYLGGIFSLIFFYSKKSRFNFSSFLISLAFILWLLADQLYLVLSNFQYISGGFLDPLWPAGCWILALASLYPRDGKCSKRFLHLAAPLKGWLPIQENVGFLLPYISITAIIILVSDQYILKDPLITGTVISVLLILLRQIFSLIENKHLLGLVQESNQLLEERKVTLEEKNRALQRLNYLKEQEANTDYLTNIPNRRHLDETLQFFPENKAPGDLLEMSLLLIDVDHFKQINDQWGHEMGDAVLRQVAFLIKNAIRSEDIAGRFGGDEFLVILPKANLQHAELIAERILRKVVLADYTENGRTLKVSLSIGCTHWYGPAGDYDVNKILLNADKALYKAKAGGRNQYRVKDLENID